jgi:hypothetical protein
METERTKMIFEIADGLLNTAKYNLRKDGHLCPVSFIIKDVTEDDASVRCIIPESFKTQEDKEAFANLLSVMCRSLSADALVMIFESWVYPVTKTANYQEEKTEAIVCLLQIADGREFANLCKVERNEGVIEIRESGWFEKGGKVAVCGLFDGLLKNNKDEEIN